MAVEHYLYCFARYFAHHIHTAKARTLKLARKVALGSFVEHDFPSIQTCKTASTTIDHSGNIIAAVGVALHHTAIGISRSGVDR